MGHGNGLRSNPIKVLLLENIHKVAVNALKQSGFEVDFLPSALSEEELTQKIGAYHVLGIRSKTRVTNNVLSNAKKLMCVACFCIGTDQVDLTAAQKYGITVFNSPFSNTRSVAELILAEVIALSRRLTDRSKEMHQGIWNKCAKDCHEIRGKTLGIVGYGHIGSQLSVMAESMGMTVIYHDIRTVLSHGNSRACDTLDDLLKEADFVTLHVPKTDQTYNMITETQISKMKKGSYLLNASRGSVVNLGDLVKALKSGHLAGAAIDVYPTEPESNTNSWESELQKCPNTILTPHIGGSTEEAQYAIAAEVSEKVIKHVTTGSTMTAVNFPIVDMPKSSEKDIHRILNIHENKPGVLKTINSILCDFNISGQMLATQGQIGYIIIDVEEKASGDLMKNIADLPFSIKTRILY